MKEHLKHHKIKEKQPKKEFWVLADKKQGFLQRMQIGFVMNIIFTNKLCKARKFQSKDEALDYYQNIPVVHYNQLLPMLSTGKEALFLQKLLKDK